MLGPVGKETHPHNARSAKNENILFKYIDMISLLIGPKSKLKEAPSSSRSDNIGYTDRSLGGYGSKTSNSAPSVSWFPWIYSVGDCWFTMGGVE